MRTLLRFGAAVAFVTVAILSGAPASAHHSRAGYDQAKDKLTTLNGVIAEVIWRNPHVYLTWDSKDEKGNRREVDRRTLFYRDDVERRPQPGNVQARRSTGNHIHAHQGRHTAGAGHPHRATGWESRARPF